MVLGYFRHKFGQASENSDNKDPRYTSSDKYEADCFSCRLVGIKYLYDALCGSAYSPRLGSMTMVGLGGYTYYSGMKNLREQRKVIAKSPTKFGYGSRQVAIVTIACSLASLGVFRMFN